MIRRKSIKTEHTYARSDALHPPGQRARLIELFLANSPLRPELLLEIEEAEILSSFFMDFLYDADSGTSLRRLMEMNITGLATELDQLIQKIARSGLAYESDPESEADQFIYINDYINQISLVDAKNMKRSYAAWLASSGDYASAIALLANETQLSAYRRILELEESVGGDWSQLSAAQISELWTIYLSDSDWSNTMALGILHEIGEADFEPEPRVPIQYRSLQIGKENSRNELPLLGVWPNPAMGSTWLHYPMDADEHATIEVYDSQGGLVQAFRPNSNGLVELSLHGYKSGIYTVRLFAFDKVVDTIRLTVLSID